MSLDKKMDRILAREQSGQQSKRIKNRALRKLLANKLSIIGTVIFVTIMVLCLLAPLFTPYNPAKTDLRARLQPPGAEHILGTDKVGRDIFARILYGGRISIFVGFGSALLVTLIGVSLGAIAGYKGGWLDATIMKISELLMSFPQIILVLILVSVTGPSVWNLIFIFSLTGWPSMYRMTRSQMLSLREREYVQALRAFGIGSFRIAYKHILPNAIGPIIVNITLSTAMFILQEASLSFLGLGVPLEVATWGNIINVAKDLTILKENWWIWLPTGITITLFVLSINFIGDGLRDASDPSEVG